MCINVWWWLEEPFGVHWQSCFCQVVVATDYHQQCECGNSFCKVLLVPWKPLYTINPSHYYHYYYIKLHNINYALKKNMYLTRQPQVTNTIWIKSPPLYIWIFSQKHLSKKYTRLIYVMFELLYSASFETKLHHLDLWVIDSQSFFEITKTSPLSGKKCF